MRPADEPVDDLEAEVHDDGQPHDDEGRCHIIG